MRLILLPGTDTDPKGCARGPEGTPRCAYGGSASGRRRADATVPKRGDDAAACATRKTFACRHVAAPRTWLSETAEIR